MTRYCTVFLLLAGSAFAQNSGFQQWAEGKRATSSDKLDRILSAAEAGSDRAASSAPSLDSASSAVVDRSNPGEFFNAAVNLAGMNGRPTTSSPTGSFTVTIYSLVAALQRQSLVDPVLYERNRYLRRVAFTLGTAASDLDKDGTETPGALYGVRWRLMDGPDLFSKAKGKNANAKTTIKADLQARLNANNSFSLLGTKMVGLIVAKLGPAAAVNPTVADYESVYQSASPEDRAAIDQLIESWEKEDQGLERSVLELREHMKRPRQLSLAYFTNQRTDGGADDHRLELIYDWGLAKQVDWTINGGFEYRNVVNVGGDRKGGRLASEARFKLFQLSDPGDTAEKWVSLNMGGEWKASTGAKPYLKAQVRLSIPLTGGVSLPIAWSYESRPSLTPTIQSNDSFRRFRFGIEFDPAKIANLGK